MSVCLGEQWPDTIRFYLWVLIQMSLVAFGEATRGWGNRVEAKKSLCDHKCSYDCPGNLIVTREDDCLT